jgi:hypothetical protein
LRFTSREAIKPLAKGESVKPVVLHPLAAFVPVLGLHDVIGSSQRGQLPVESGAESPGLTGAPAPALRAALEAVYLAPLDS